jgi:hypothetical protein
VSADEWQDFIAADGTVDNPDGSWFSRDVPPGVEADERPDPLPRTIAEARRWFADQNASLTVGVLGDEAYADVTHPQEGHFSSYAISREPDQAAAEAVRRWIRQHTLNR